MTYTSSYLARAGYVYQRRELRLPSLFLMVCIIVRHIIKRPSYRVLINTCSIASCWYTSDSMCSIPQRKGCHMARILISAVVVVVVLSLSANSAEKKAYKSATHMIWVEGHKKVEAARKKAYLAKIKAQEARMKKAIAAMEQDG